MKANPIHTLVITASEAEYHELYIECYQLNIAEKN